MNTKKTLLTLLVVGFIGVGLLSAGTVHAQERVTNDNLFTKLVEKLSTTFGLDKAKVQEVVNQVHSENKAERQAEMKKKQEDRLTKLVSEGKITEAQKSAIIAKHAEMQQNFNPDSFKNMTVEERKAAMEKHRTELEAWAKSEGIDRQYLMMGHGRGFKGGPGMHIKSQ